MRRGALRDVQTEHAARVGLRRGVARAGPRAEPAAPRRRGARRRRRREAARRAREPPRRLRARAPRRVQGRGGAGRLVLRRRRAAPRAPRGGLRVERVWRLRDESVAARAAGARRGERRLRPLRGRGAGEPLVRAELRSRRRHRGGPRPRLASNRAGGDRAGPAGLHRVRAALRAGRGAPGVPARHVPFRLRLRALPGGTAGRHAGRGGAARDGRPPLRVRRAAAAGVFSVRAPRAADAGARRRRGRPRARPRGRPRRRVRRRVRRARALRRKSGAVPARVPRVAARVTRREAGRGGPARRRRKRGGRGRRRPGP